MILPAVVDLYVGNADWLVFAISASLIGGLAIGVATATQGVRPPVSARFGFLLVNILWITTAAAGAVPLYLASFELSLTDAVFESVSALTTTGSTVISGLDSLPPGLLLWRSVLQWIGGVGVIALGLFVLPFLRVGGVSYLRIESSDIGDRPIARLSSFMATLVAAYTLLTFACAVAYKIAGMTGFDAMNHAMTTLATGGFSTHDASLGHYSETPAVLWVGTFFMFVAALPFSILILLALRGRVDPLGDPQIKVFAGYCAAFVLMVAVYWRLTADVPLGTALTHSAFNFVSIITTTGYASGDYSAWGPFVVACAFVATFLGGCSGSTSGGVKAYRFNIMFELLASGLCRLIYPSSVETVRYAHRTVDREMQRAVVLFIAVFLLLLCTFTLLLSLAQVDFVTALTGALTALTNVGPGLGEVIGPAGNFAPLSDAAKWILVAAMLLGRLEILAVLVLLSPVFWRE
ncbi:TrkH family potassium uptake protein [Chelativorans sp. YIM 93263]|uniref:TrkH family potassium uptake protein n=1 Tax=Chelativorans sp. YIM 93263 TaxID=2906648 RepID=UPI002378D506|nr:TrkH family potassium uptake protein [Chelativorans sp. YIM 93263]